MPKNGIVQWGWAEMEELLQCPVCLDIPASGPGITVEQCIHGHHICAPCRTQVENCPLCKCSFHGTRNFVVEELVRHYEILKNTMLLNGIVSETKFKTPKVKGVNGPVLKPTSVVRRRNVNTPNANKGLYPCRLPDCTANLPAGRLLNHARSFHADILTEAVVDFTDSYTHTWEITYKNRKPLNRYSYVVFVSGIGLVYLNIEILRPGQLVVVVQMAMKYKQAQNFLASIEFFSEVNRYAYNTRLVSVRDTTKCMIQKKLGFTLSKNQIRNLCVNKKFNCKMRLSRFNPVDAGLLTRPNVEQLNIIAGIRASLIAEENDKKIIKELEMCNNRKPNINGSVGEQAPSRKYERLTKLATENGPNTSADNLQTRQENSSISNNNSSQNLISLPSVSSIQPAPRRKRNNKNKKRQ